MSGRGRAPRLGELGAVLPTTLIIVAVGLLLVVPVLSFARSVVHRAAVSEERVEDFYSADAGVEDALWRLWHDLAFRQAIMSTTPQAYTIALNSQTVGIRVEPWNPGEPTPTPAPTPTPKPGNTLYHYTHIDPAIVNIVADPNPTVTTTLYFRNAGSSSAKLAYIEYLLPRGWTFNSGSITWGNLTNVPEPDIYNPAVSGPPWSYTGPDPWNACAYKSAEQASDQERLTWDYRGSEGATAPRVGRGVTGWISFTMTLTQVEGPGRYYDNPWVYVSEVSQAQCGVADLNAGLPASVLVVMTVQIQARAEDDDVVVTGHARLGEDTRIQRFHVE